MTLPSKYPSSKERRPRGAMLDVFIIMGFVGLIYLPLYLGVKGLFGPDASFYVPVMTSILAVIVGWLGRFLIRYFLRRYL